MIATPYGGVSSNGGTYPGDMYAPVTIPTAVNYAIQAPSQAPTQQIAPPNHEVALNTYVPPVALSASPPRPATLASVDNCGCASQGLRWYEIVSAVALVVIAVAAFRKA